MSCLSRWAFFTQTPVHRFAVLGVVETMPLAPAMTSEARDDNTENNWSCNCVRTKNRANKSQATLMAPSMPTASFFTQTPVHRFAVLGVVETMPLAPAMTSEARDDNTENNWSCNCVRTKNRANKSQATLMAPSMPTASFFMQTPVQVGDAKEASQKRPRAPKCTRTRPELPCIKHETDCIKLLIIRDNPSPWISNGIPEPGWEFPIS